VGATVATDYVLVGLMVAALAGLSLALWLSPPTLTLSFVAYGILAGGLRRLVDALTDGDSGVAVFVPLSFATVVAVLLAARAWRNRPMDLVDKAVLVLIVLALLGALNPLGGGLVVGLAGAAVFVAPMAWYWVGRTLLSRADLTRVYALVVALAVVVAVVGLFQSFDSFLAFDREWAERTEFSSLYLAGANLRAFGTLASPAEYGRLLAVALLLVVALPRIGRFPFVLRLTVAALLGVAIFLSGIRSALVVTAFGLLALVLVSRSLPGVTKAVVVGVGIVAVIALGRLQTTPSSPDVAPDPESAAEAATTRQVLALRDPLNPEVSTLTDHAAITLNTFENTLHEPFGAGTGTVTNVPKKLGAEKRSAEGDPGKIALAWGLPGLFALALFGIALATRLLRVNRRVPDGLGGPALAIASGAILQWLNPGFYVIGALFWLATGGLVAEYVAARQPVEAPLR
jgi:hypothetical protein